MKLYRGMPEIDFINAIDTSLDFEKDEEYEEATRIACSISDNAVLMIGYELASNSSHASLDVNLKLLEIMKKERPTPIICAAIPVIKSIIKNKRPSRKNVSKLLELTRKHGNAWNSLGIIECADESLANICKEICESWMKRKTKRKNNRGRYIKS